MVHNTEENLKRINLSSVKIVKIWTTEKFAYFCSTQTTEMHILAVIMLHQHTFCVYKGKRKLKLLITCENFVLFCILTVFIFILVCKYFFGNVESSV